MAFWTIIATIASIFAGGASYVQAKKAAKAAKKAADLQKGLLVNKESNVEPIPVIYGQRRVGGTRVFISSDGREVVPGDPDYTSLYTQYYSDYDADTDVYAGLATNPTNKYLYVAIVLCEGRVENITDIRLDDIPITDSKWQGKVSTQIYTGSDDQVAAPLLRQSNERWTSNHRLRGVAYIACRFEYDADVFNGIPDITALVTGRRIYDPREVGQSSSDQSTWAYSNNPALCLLDYLTNTRFGKGIPYSAIDTAAFIEAANDCDSSVTLYDGGGSGKLFECNAVLDTGQTIFDNVNRLLLAMRGFLPYSQGVYQLRIDKSRSSVMSFDTDNIIGGITIRGESKQDKFNRVTVKFANPDNNWQDDAAIWPPADSTEESDYLAEDGGVFLYDEIELEAITNYYQARDLARIFLLRSRNALRCGFQCTSDALQLAVGDVVTVTHATPGFVAKPFQVDEIAINTDGTCTLSLLEYDSTIYTWEVGTEQTTYPDTYLPNAYLVGPPSGLVITESSFVNTDGTVMIQADVEWTASVDNTVTQYELQVKKTADPDTAYVSVFSSTNTYTFTSANGGIYYTLRIRAINALGIKSDWISDTILFDGKTDTPTSASGIAAASGVNNIKITWTKSADKDIAEYKIYRGTTSTYGSATYRSSTKAEYFVDQNITAGVTYYYWVVTVDTSGNESSPIGPVSGVATTIADGIVDGSIGVAKFAAGIEPVSLVSSIPGTKSTEVIYNTTTDKLYKWNGSSYVIVAPEVFSDLGGAIISTQITDGAISTPKLAANAVTAAKIAANTITASQIAADTITAGQIAAGAIGATELAADSVSVVKLISNTSKTYGNFQFEMGTSTSVAGYQGAGIFRTAATSGFGIGGLGNADNSFAVAGQQAYDSANAYASAFLNSTTLGGSTHRSFAFFANNTRAAYLQAGSKSVQLANASYAIQTVGDVYVSGNITATGTISPFTGSHDGLVSNELFPELGDIMVDVEIVAKTDISNTLALMGLSQQAETPAIGVFSGYSPNLPSCITMTVQGAETAPGVFDTETVLNPDHAGAMTDRKVIAINALGEGQINVCGENGQILAGDLIVTSSIPGKGMRQSDDIIRSKTVAKARESAFFVNQSEIKQIACIYLCG